MAAILGLGGVFLKAKDPKALADWYQEVLGINFNGSVYTVLAFADNEGKISPGYNVLSFFNDSSSYFAPSTKQSMLNLRVSELPILLEELRVKGVTVVGDMLEEEYGKFGWILDPEGNKIELWEPGE